MGREELTMSDQPEIRFYRATGDYGFLSNLYPAEIRFDGERFPSSEYAYQFGKPNKPEIALWLLAAPTASLCAQAAHALLPWQVRQGWAGLKVERMRQVLRAKFEQHVDLALRLAETGAARLVEESTTDAFWGVGKKGTGKNMLGELLMELRAAILSGKRPEGLSHA